MSEPNAIEAFGAAGAARVAILDIDYHHRDGTQAIFYPRDDRLFVSLHGDPDQEYPYFTGYGDETGAGPGEGFNLNLPMPWGPGGTAMARRSRWPLSGYADSAPRYWWSPWAWIPTNPTRSPTSSWRARTT